MSNVVEFADYVTKNNIKSSKKNGDKRFNSKQEWQIEVIKKLYSYADGLTGNRFRDVLNHIQLSMISAEVLAECDFLFDGHSITDILEVLNLTKQFASKMYLDRQKKET